MSVYTDNKDNRVIKICFSVQWLHSGKAYEPSRWLEGQVRTVVTSLNVMSVSVAVSVRLVRSRVYYCLVYVIYVHYSYRCSPLY